MYKLSPNLPTPQDLTTALLTRLRQTGRRVFVDAGCGNGELLLAIARHYPGLECHGFELSPLLCAGLRAAIQQQGLPNVAVHQADLRTVLDVVPTADFIFTHVSGAMHQALAMYLAGRDFRGTLCSALYPCYPFPATHMYPRGSLPTFEYTFPACNTHLLWDAPASVALAPQPTYTLLNRAATFFRQGRLTVQVQAPAALHGCVTVHLAQPKVAVGQTLMLDFIVDTTRLAEPLLPTLVTIGLACNGVALWPAHRLILGYHPTAIVERGLSADGDEALLRSVEEQEFLTLYRLLAAGSKTVPAVQLHHS